MFPRKYKNHAGVTYWTWDMWSRLRFVLTGDCGYVCNMEIFCLPEVDYHVQQFVPEAGCPVHDRMKTKEEKYASL